MKSLVDIAKEMGFPPNPDMTKDDWNYLVDAIKTYLLHTNTGLSADNPAEKKRRSKFNYLPALLYHTNCLQKRGGYPDVVENNVKCLKSQNDPDTFTAPQTIPGDLKTTNFIWHHPRNATGGEDMERFTANINMGSRIFPDMLKKLNAFARKHNASFKFPNAHFRHRIDTLNVYMTKNITSETASELYGILKPCLRSHYHDRLNGQELFMNDSPVKGIKIGPILNGSQSSFNARESQKNQWLKRDIANPDLRQLADSYLLDWLGNAPKSDGVNEEPVVQPSLGSVSSSIEVMNLMYYMLGKEGQNPFQLVGYDNKPYQKQISITDTTAKENNMSDSFFKKITSFFKKPEVQPTPNTSVKSAAASYFDWEDPKLWADVQVEHGDEIRFGHRINLQHLTEEQRDQIRAGLDKRHIVYSERNATTNGDKVHEGDLTIRITDPKSVEKLRGFVFEWAIGPGTRPITKPKAEYEAEQKLIREKRSPIMVSEEKPKWADKKYWEKSSVVTDGKLETNYVIDLGDPNSHLYDNPQPFGSGIEIVEALAKKGITATVGRGMTNGLPASKITHDSVIISGAENVERFEKTILHQSEKAPVMPNRGNSSGR